jgi:hypothetical protein
MWSITDPRHMIEPSAEVSSMVAWETRAVEERLRQALQQQFVSSRAETLWSLYVAARDKILTQVLPSILRTEPDLTDHTVSHIENVLDNIDNLLGPEPDEIDGQCLNAAELYYLCLCVLFHDVGIVYQRSGHENKIMKVYTWVREGENRMPGHEQYIVLKAAGAHTGTTENGSSDTIGRISKEVLELHGEPVRIGEIASILRLADELAEGPQRTSLFIDKRLGYGADSQIYHDYAGITTIDIQRRNRRIAITYNIRMKSTNGKIQPSVDELRSLLDFTFKRIVKTDEERRYTRFYSNILEPFQYTTVQLNFWLDGNLEPLDLSPLELSDLRIPGTNDRTLRDTDHDYDVDKICTKVEQLSEAMLREASV